MVVCSLQRCVSHHSGSKEGALGRVGFRDGYLSLQCMVWSGAGLGPSTDIEGYAQESGSVCCNGQRAKTILIAGKNQYISEQMKSYVANDTECRRVQIYKQFQKGEAVHSNKPKCSCCDVCSVQCLCGECKYSVYNSHFLY